MDSIGLKAIWCRRILGLICGGEKRQGLARGCEIRRADDKEVSP